MTFFIGAWRKRTGRRRKGVIPEEETGLCSRILAVGVVEALPLICTIVSLWNALLIDR